MSELGVFEGTLQGMDKVPGTHFGVLARQCALAGSIASPMVALLHLLLAEAKTEQLNAGSSNAMGGAPRAALAGMSRRALALILALRVSKYRKPVHFGC